MRLMLESFVSLFALIVLASSAAGDDLDPTAFQIDGEGPLDLVFNGARTSDFLITSVRTYITGPRMSLFRGPIKGFNTWVDHKTLLRMRPLLVLTNRAEIRGFVEVLTEHDNGTANSNLIGYTHHLLLLDEPGKRLMHFRVFSPSLTNTAPAMVYPRTSTGTGYRNTNILAWLVARYRTNETFKKLVAETKQ